MTGDQSLPRRVRRVLREFAAQPDVTPDHMTVLGSVLATSRTLTHQLDAAIRSGDLRGLAPLPEDSHVGGSYNGDSRLISVPLRILEPDLEAEATFVLGHEAQHALARNDMIKAEERFFTDAEVAARTGNDYTSTIDAYLQYQRSNESAANLAGWNALADRVRTANPAATPDNIVLMSERSQDFVVLGSGPDLYALRPGLLINRDLTFDLTSENVEAMARYYFDKDAEHTKIGYLGNSDYRNAYGSWAVSQAVACHRYFTQNRSPQPLMIINAARLGLSRKIMEENGIDLEGCPIQPYLDCSTSPPRLDVLHHTIQTHQYVPADQQPPARPATTPDLSVGIARRTLAPRPMTIQRRESGQNPEWIGYRSRRTGDRRER